MQTEQLDLQKAFKQEKVDNSRRRQMTVSDTRKMQVTIEEKA